ncbi:MAG: hypothetical protein H7233_06685, partial [Pseudorhodobacter sp.]|nr:hypothetical protein [Frankiaceae bacterium]
HIGAQVYNQPAGLTWNEEAVADPEAARAFYGSVFGFTFTEVPDAGGRTTFATTGDALGGLGGALTDPWGARLSILQLPG